jgi:hypothetical protein
MLELSKLPWLEFGDFFDWKFPLLVGRLNDRDCLITPDDGERLFLRDKELKVIEPSRVGVCLSISVEKLLDDFNPYLLQFDCLSNCDYDCDCDCFYAFYIFSSKSKNILERFLISPP